MRVKKWSNSLAVRLPAPLVKALALKAGDDAEIQVVARNQTDGLRKSGWDKLLKRLRVFRVRLPDDFKFDREEANARTVNEIWNAGQSAIMTEWHNEDENIYNRLV